MERVESLSAYDRWMAKEGLPVLRGHSVEEPMSLTLAPWDRMGGSGAYVDLEGMEGMTGMYVCEIPPGGSLKPEKHIYEEIVYIIAGQGAAELWQAGGKKQWFEWGQGSVFAPPLNTWHRLSNGTNKPARFLAFTTAPLIMDLYHNVDFIFDCDFVFEDRYNGQEEYFVPSGTRNQGGIEGSWWETNFIPDVRTTAVDLKEVRGPRVRITQIEPAGNTLVGHIAEWPSGYYQKAHYHGAGAVLVIVRGHGYSIMWPKEIGINPYRDGKADQVVRVNWQEGTAFSPPDGWFHQHFNPGPGPARQLAARYGSRKHLPKWIRAGLKRGLTVSVKEGGTLIESEDEDPEIRRIFEAEVSKSKQSGLQKA